MHQAVLELSGTGSSLEPLSRNEMLQTQKMWWFHKAKWITYANHWANLITNILFDIWLSILIIHWCHRSQSRTFSVYYSTVVASFVLTQYFWGCSAQTGHAIILLSTMHDSFAHNRMPEWTRNLILHSQTCVSSSSVSLGKFKHKS